MLGRTHILMAALATDLVVGAADPRITLAHRAFCTAIGGGAGGLNDIDAVKSRVSRSVGFVTEGLAHVARKVSGGHREGTHTWLGEAVFGSLAAVPVALIHDRWAQWMLGALLTILFATLLELRIRVLRAVIVSSVAALAVVWFRYDLHSIAWAILIGTIVHGAGDACTEHGLQPFKPFSDAKVWLLPEGHRIRTGSKFEQKRLAPVVVMGLAITFAWNTGLLHAVAPAYHYATALAHGARS
jgi:membrane-bound metal-dependent hydrolase YbcI (DUF457 family)